jgi:tetratricopeptide (TPR) repeat protein
MSRNIPSPLRGGDDAEHVNAHTTKPEVYLSPSLPSTRVREPKMSAYEQFEHLREQVIDLNQRGLELHAAERYNSALFYFNEAFRLATSLGSQILELDIDLDQVDAAASSNRDIMNGALFCQKPAPPKDFLQPLDIGNKGVPCSMGDVEAWILIASMTLMINGSLGHLAMKKLDNAEQLLLMAIALSDEDNEDDVEDEDENDFEALRRKYHVKMVSMTVYFALGHVQSKAEANSKLTEERLRECLDAFTQSLATAEDILGTTHLATAGIYVSIGQVLLREGFIRGASLSFQSADRIYNLPRATGTGLHPELEGGGDSAMSHLSDLEVSFMLLREGWSFGAAMA